MEEKNIDNRPPTADLDEQDLRYVLLARMARERKETPCPDVEQAWESCKKQHIHARHQYRANLLRLWGAALLGAAAMLAGVMIYNYATSMAADPATRQAIIAMTYDETPQHITLQREDEAPMNLSRHDSLSFRTAKQPAKPLPHAGTSSTAALLQEESRMQKLSTPRGMDFKVILPDGSEVWLNAQSTIEFPAAFSKNERRVMLQGEAFFKVARNEQSPFIVTSDRMQVRVLGTEFNFRNYASEPPAVSLVNGAVEVMHPGASVPEATLQPGEAAWTDEAGELHTGKADTYAATQWVNGFFYFDELPLVEILCELGRWYNLGVVFRNPDSMQCRIHFSAPRNEAVEHTIEGLNRLQKARITVEGTDIVVY